MNPKKTSLILDIDDTLADTAHHCIRTICQKFKLSLDVNQVLASYLQPAHVPGWAEPELAQEITYLLNDHEFLRSVPPVSHAAQTIKTLNQIASVEYYLTSRTADKAHTTAAWLADHHFPQVPIVFREPTETAPDWKLQHLSQQRGADVQFIDNELGLLALNSFSTQKFSYLPIQLIWFNAFHHQPQNTLPLREYHSWPELHTFFTST